MSQNSTDMNNNMILKNRTLFRQLRLLGFLSTIACLLGLLSVFIHQSPLVNDWENRFQTYYYSFRSAFVSPKAPTLPLVVVLIDDHSLPEGTSRSPINRAYLAGLIKQVSVHQPALSVLNILLDRPSTAIDDEMLTTTIQDAGNIIIRSDPFYPPISLFAKASLDKGTFRFRLDSTDTVQEICHHPMTCQNKEILHINILNHYRRVSNQPEMDNSIKSDWMKINFLNSRQLDGDKKLLNFPVFRAHELAQLPESALKDKLVLIGTGFPDLYPMYRVPLASPELMVQETEVLAHVLNMMADKNYIHELSPYMTGLIVTVILICFSLLLVFGGPLFSFLASMVFMFLAFLMTGWMFAFHNVEIQFVLPTIFLMVFGICAILYHTVQERFLRLNTELLLKQAKIDFLTNELHSHHLFNEFSRLSVMIRKDPKSAREYLIEFADMLRASLKYGDQQRVSVQTQLEYIQAYIKQQEIIFQKRLQFNLNTDEDWQEVYAPWHLFFPLVENAVKYTEGYLRQNPKHQAVIDIKLVRFKNSLVFSVQNPFIEGSKVATSRTGLKNLQERLDLFYPKGGFYINVRQKEQLWITLLRLPI